MNALTKIEAATPQLWLDVPKDQTFEEWQETGQKLCQHERVMNWWIGDWWAAGHHRYGERAKVAAEGIFGLSFKSLATYGSVCRAFERSRRLEHLDFSHHQEVASLPTAEADRILRDALDNRTSVREVRRAVLAHRIDAGEIQPREPRDDPEDDAFVSAAQTFNKWTIETRIMILQSVEEMGAIEITDESKVGNIRL